MRARGRAPGELLHDFDDVIASSAATGTIEIVIDDGHAAVVASDGIDARVLQRLRNVVGRFTLARLRGAPRVRPD